MCDGAVLGELTTSELLAAMIAFREARDEFARRGAAGSASLCNYVLLALARERQRREREWEKFKQELRRSGLWDEGQDAS